MLGAVKGDGAAGGIPLFRMLARRWVPLAPVKRQTLARTGDEPQPTRKWISKPRQVAAPADSVSRPSWSPWLWMK